MMHPTSMSPTVRHPRLQPLAPSQMLNRCLSPVGREREHRDPVKSNASPFRSAPPLPRVGSDPDPPALRPRTLIPTPSTTSRASTLMSSPLDEVPERLWDRILPTSSTPETTNPNLSLEEITSTRLSSDEHPFLYPSYQSSSLHGTSHGTMGLQKAFENGIKSFKKKIKRVRGSIFPNNSRDSHASLATDSGEQGPDPNSQRSWIEGMGDVLSHALESRILGRVRITRPIVLLDAHKLT